MKPFNPPCVLSIAGTDPSGGAGIQADIKAISATGAYAASVITALVAQNTQGVQSIFDVPPEFVVKQLESVISDLNIVAVKIGMIHNQRLISVVADFLAKTSIKHIVFDPVMVAKNGCNLLEPDTIDFLMKTLLPRVTLITPNLPEAEKLLNNTIDTPFTMAHAAKKLADEYRFNVLIKGGHLDTPQSSDVLYDFHTQTHHWFHAERVVSKHTHGTGCTFSSAIASYLAQGFSLQQAISTGKQYLTKAIEAGRTLQVGQGRGPVDHFYFLENRKQNVSTHA
jgi:hydroxymethylpyrimidine/phosphomethylpyrimidine kinase